MRTIFTPAQLAASLRNLRKASDLTQQQLAAKAGLQQKTVSKLEVSPDGVEIRTLFLYLSALGANLALDVDTRRP